MHRERLYHEAVPRARVRHRREEPRATVERAHDGPVGRHGARREAARAGRRRVHGVAHVHGRAAATPQLPPRHTLRRHPRAHFQREGEPRAARAAAAPQRRHDEREPAPRAVAVHHLCRAQVAAGTLDRARARPLHVRPPYPRTPERARPRPHFHFAGHEAHARAVGRHRERADGPRCRGGGGLGRRGLTRRRRRGQRRRRRRRFRQPNRMHCVVGEAPQHDAARRGERHDAVARAHSDAPQRRRRALRGPLARPRTRRQRARHGTGHRGSAAVGATQTETHLPRVRATAAGTHVRDIVEQPLLQAGPVPHAGPRTQRGRPRLPRLPRPAPRSQQRCRPRV